MKEYKLRQPYLQKLRNLNAHTNSKYNNIGENLEEKNVTTHTGIIDLYED